MVRSIHKIKDLLCEAGLVSAEEWAAAKGQGKNVVDALLARGILSETALMEVLGRASGVPPVDLTHVTPDPAALDCIPQESCREWGVLPLTRNGDVLTIATSDPFHVVLLDDLRRMTNCHVRTVYVHGAMIKVAIENVFQTGRKQVQDLLEEVGEGDTGIRIEEEQAEDIETAASGDDAPAVRMINVIILRALRDKASDIHIEPMEKHIRVRYRIDGRMKIVMTPPKGLLNALISRIKIISQLDIAERFNPQDGKFQLRYEGRSIDFRVSILPVVGGEKAVLRILDTGSKALRLATMGYEDNSLQDILRAIKSAYGMMLVTGPTGSGKSTTLYSCVQEIADPEVNLVTVEDPVEYRMDGINQVPVNPKRGMTFAGALRSILRQDPDIILVGEIRDTRDGGHRDQGRPHGPPRAVHPPHERRRERRDAAPRHGSRPVHGVELDPVRLRPASGPAAVLALQVARAGSAAQALGGDRVPRSGLREPADLRGEREGLRALQQGVPRTLSDPRDAPDVRQDQTPRDRGEVCRRHQDSGAGGRNAHSPARRHLERDPWNHLSGRGVEDHDRRLSES